MYFTIPIATYNNLYFETNISGGFLKYTSPEQEIYAQLETYIWELDKQHASKTNAFTIVFNAGLRYKLQKHICLSLSIDFFNSKPKFTDVEYESTIANYSLSQKDTWTNNIEQKINTYNIKAGLVFTIDRRNQGNSY